jgi:hypothetical protein
VNPDPKTTITIKVTDNKHRCYYVHFDRESHDLLDVCEYHTIYLPGMGVPAQRAQIVIDSAKSRLGQPVQTPATGEPQ